MLEQAVVTEKPVHVEQILRASGTVQPAEHAELLAGGRRIERRLAALGLVVAKLEHTLAPGLGQAATLAGALGRVC